MEWSFSDIFWVGIVGPIMLIVIGSFFLSFVVPERYESYFDSVWNLPFDIGERIVKIPYLIFVVVILFSLFLIYGGVLLIMDTINNRISLIGEVVEVTRYIQGKVFETVREYGTNWDIFTIIVRIGMGCVLLVIGISGVYQFPKIKNKKYLSKEEN